MTSQNTLPEYLQAQIKRLTATEKKRLAEIINDVIPCFHAVHDFIIAGKYSIDTEDEIGDWKRYSHSIGKKKSLLRQMKALVEVPPMLDAIGQEGPDGGFEFSQLRPNPWPNFEEQRHHNTLEWLEAIKEAIANQTQRKRHRRSPRKSEKLTTQQLEAFTLVGDHKGNVQAAADAGGKSRQAMDKLYQKALKKLADTGIKKPKMQNLPHDYDGQVIIEDSKGPKAPRGRVTRKTIERD